MNNCVHVIRNQLISLPAGGVRFCPVLRITHYCHYTFCTVLCIKSYEIKIISKIIIIFKVFVQFVVQVSPDPWRFGFVPCQSVSLCTVYLPGFCLEFHRSETASFMTETVNWIIYDLGSPCAVLALGHLFVMDVRSQRHASSLSAMLSAGLQSLIRQIPIRKASFTRFFMELDIMSFS